MKHAVIIAAAVFSGTFPLASLATSHTPAPAHAEHHGASAEGEVRRIDKEQKKLTIRHGPIANLDMPAMTMVFQVQDAAVLDQVKVGDKIRFNAEKVGGSYTVTRVEAAK